MANIRVSFLILVLLVVSALASCPAGAQNYRIRYEHYLFATGGIDPPIMDEVTLTFTPSLCTELVSTLVDRTVDGGLQKVAWDGRDSAGDAVASGIYFYRLVAGNFAETKKMVLLR